MICVLVSGFSGEISISGSIASSNIVSTGEDSTAAFRLLTGFDVDFFTGSFSSVLDCPCIVLRRVVLCMTAVAEVDFRPLFLGDGTTAVGSSITEDQF